MATKESDQEPETTESGPTKRKTPSRDDTIIRLYLAGYTQEAIGRKVGLSRVSVNKILKQQLATISKDQLFASENRMVIFLARQEQLLRAAFEHVENGELRAIEVARRLLAQQADIEGLTDDLAGFTMPPPMSDNELTPAPPTDDELAKFRQRRGETG